MHCARRAVGTARNGSCCLTSGGRRPRVSRDGTRLTVDFAPKGDGKTLVAVEHIRLPDAAAAAHAKQVWRDRLTGLKAHLEG